MLNILLFSVLSFSTSGTESDAKSAAERLARSLNEVTVVEFHLLSRTVTYDYSASEFRSNATIVVRRTCGGNCKRFMQLIIDHTRSAVASNCPVGQQSTLIVFGKTEIFYSYSGRSIKLDGTCYFNKSSVESIIKQDRFIFH